MGQPSRSRKKVGKATMNDIRVQKCPKRRVEKIPMDVINRLYERITDPNEELKMSKGTNQTLTHILNKSFNKTPLSLK